MAIVLPGIIDTAMARRLGEVPYASPYPHMRHITGLFAASLQNPTTPFLVGQKICDIIESDTWQLRHPRRACCRALSAVARLDER